MFITVEKIEVKKGKQIGKGGFGFVYQGEKKMAVSQLQNGKRQQILQALKGKKFEHIIEVFAFEEKGNDGIFIIMELGERIDLKNLPNKTKTCLQIAKGVSELHQLGFFHRDLKLDNFVFGQDNKIKMIDFGTTKQMLQEVQTQNQGTFIFMAPEVIRTKDYDSSVDIWSLGMVFYEIFTNETFFEKSSNIAQITENTEITQYEIDEKLRQQGKKKQFKNMKKNYQKNDCPKIIKDPQDKTQKTLILNKSIKRISIDQVIKDVGLLNEKKVKQPTHIIRI